MNPTARLSGARKHFDPMVFVGFLLPVALAVLIGLAIHAHSKPIQAPIAQTTNSSGGVTATTPVDLPTAGEVSAANSAILTYCSNDLRSDTTCSLVANSNKTAPGFVESGLQMSGHFATDGNSSQGIALAKGSGGTWSVVWVGQNCIPKDIASQNSVPSSLNICSS